MSDYIKRDRWGRPLIPNPLPDGKAVAHQRPSSIASKIADRYNLELWSQRMVAKGIAEREDLLSLAHALDPEDSDDKRQLNDVVKKAKEAARSSQGANTGTALHSYVRQVNAGQEVTPLPAHAPAINAYKRAIDAHGIDPSLLEQFVVWPDKLIAGSCDIFGTYQGAMRVLDLKTGKHNPADWSLMEYAAQLACYANATHTWDGNNAEPLPEIDTEVGIIIWLPAGGDICELIEVDLVKGARYVDLALEVQAAQKDKKIGTKVATPAATQSAPPEVEATSPAQAPQSLASPRTQKIGELRGRLRILVDTTDCTTDDVKESWPEGAPPLTDENHTDESLNVIEGMVMLLEMAHGIDKPQATTVEAIIERLQVLPSDIFADVQAGAKALEPQVPNLRSGKATEADIARLMPLVEYGEMAAAERLAQLVNHLSPLDEAQADAIVAWATEQRSTPLKTAGVPALKTLDDLEAERVMALAELYEADPDDLGAWLIDVCGSKSAALASGKEIARRHDWPKPKSSADLAENRVLAALTATAAKETV